MPMSRSPGRPSASTWRAKTRSKPKSLPAAVRAEVSVVRAIAGRPRRSRSKRTVNSVAMMLAVGGAAAIAAEEELAPGLEHRYSRFGQRGRRLKQGSARSNSATWSPRRRLNSAASLERGRGSRRRFLGNSGKPVKATWMLASSTASHKQTSSSSATCCSTASSRARSRASRRRPRCRCSSMAGERRCSAARATSRPTSSSYGGRVTLVGIDRRRCRGGRDHALCARSAASRRPPRPRREPADHGQDALS